jgi:S1-C subfamily serine protease
MTTDFRDISNALADVVARASASVVRVDARRRYPASGIVWSAEGVIVTANHAVQHDDEISVGLADGREVVATLVGRDPTTDIAVLRVEASDLQPASWVAEEKIRVGELVLALGRPGSSVEVSLGIISALGGNWRTGGGGKVSHFIKPDLVMYPGFSGGPLVGGDAEIVGMASSALVRGSGVALSQATVKPLVETLLAHGHIRRGYLGVGVQTVQIPASVAGEVGEKTGALLTSVEAESPAEVGGLLVGDILVKLDGEPIRRTDDLSVLLATGRASQAVNLQIVRGGAVQNLSLSLGERA